VRFVFSRKTILSFLWITPALALSVFAARKVAAGHDEASAPARPMIKVPIQVLKEGESPRLIYVELEAPPLPEPSTLLVRPF